MQKGEKQCFGFDQSFAKMEAKVRAEWIFLIQKEVTALIVPELILMHPEAQNSSKPRHFKASNGKRLWSLHAFHNWLLFPPDLCPMSAVTIWKDCAWQRHSYPHFRHKKNKCTGKSLRKVLRDEDPISAPSVGAYLLIPYSWVDLGDEALQNSKRNFGGYLFSLIQLSLPWEMPKEMECNALEGSIIGKVPPQKMEWL